jgi:hypothetical protein
LQDLDQRRRVVPCLDQLDGKRLAPASLKLVLSGCDAVKTGEDLRQRIGLAGFGDRGFENVEAIVESVETATDIGQGFEGRQRNLVRVCDRVSQNLGAHGSALHRLIARLRNEP